MKINLKLYASLGQYLPAEAKKNEFPAKIEGKATVIINNRTFYRSENENIFIPKKAKHRVLNESSKKKLVLIEVQTGSKFLESDIKRYSDIYGRKN